MLLFTKGAMSKITKIDFFKGYIEGEFANHSIMNGKKHSLDKELFFLKKLICKETIPRDGRRLYMIAIQIYASRNQPSTFCRRIITIFKNAIAGRGFRTAPTLHRDIQRLGNKNKFNAYEYSQEPIGRKKNKLAPKRLMFSSSSS